ncbi:chloride channel [Hyaloraphidium curvatum]|nr:chloride channel [Hyaloraphidium curvatum]
MASQTPAAPASPLGPPYANTRTFWVSFAGAVVCGGVLGLFATGYVLAIRKAPAAWSAAGDAGFPQLPASLFPGAGAPWWIGVTAAAGLIVGLGKALTGLDAYPSFAQDLAEKAVEPWIALRVCLLCVVGVCGGISMGPEAGLGAAGCLAGHVTAWLLIRAKLLPQAAMPDLVGAGAAAALAPLFPSPLLSLLISSEIGGPQGPAATALAAAGATASFAVYTALQVPTYLDASALALRYEGERNARVWDFAAALVVGLAGAAIGFIHLLIGGIVRALVTALKKPLDARLGARARIPLLTTLAGAICGLITYGLPLTFGTGEPTLASVVALGPLLPGWLLAASIAAKSVSFWTCEACGLVGGPVFPTLSMGTMMGSAAATWTGLDRAVALNAGMPAVVASFVRAPASWILLSFLSFFWNVEVLFPITVAVFASHLACVGIGGPQALMGRMEARRAAREHAKEQKAEAGAADPEQGAPPAAEKESA